MKLPLLSAKVYLIVFVVSMLSIYSSFNYKLYDDANTLRSQTVEKTDALAKLEFQKTINVSLKKINKSLDELSFWDEVHMDFASKKDFDDWYNLSLKPSHFWYRNYVQFQIYNDQGQVIHTSPQAEKYHLLPSKMPQAPLYFAEQTEQLFLIQFKPIYHPLSKKIIGYAGLAVNFIPKLIADNVFSYIDRDTLKLTQTPTTIFTPKDLALYLKYRATVNPVNDYLWGLIQNFLVEILVLGLFISLMFVVLFANFIIRPLHQLTDYLQLLKRSPDKLQSPLNKQFILKEFERLKDAIFHYHKQLVSANIEIEEQRQIAFEQARIDSLSLVLNRRAFDENWHKITKNYSKNQKNIAFMLFDCDFFKAINDTYGHEIGDEIIRISASTLKKSLPLDTNLYRIGGDEFVAIVKDRSREDCLQLAHKCYQAISSYNYQHLGISEKVFYSIGISFVSPTNANEIHLMNRQADIALYRAKKSLQNKICIYEQDEDFEEEVLLSKQRVNAIVESLKDWKKLEMHCQKIVYAQDSFTSYYSEALIRIRTDEDFILPYEILKVVNHRNLEIEMDTSVFNNLLMLLTQGKIPAGAGLSINISTQTLLQGNLVETLNPFRRFLPEHPLVIEILESTLISNIEQVTETLNTIRQQGFKVALDDFGSGYSSIKYLAWMPVDIIKFDLSLTQSLLGDDKTRNIIENTAAMIRSAGYDLVMEGIETEELKQAAIKAGATHLQGYLFEHPRPILQ